MEKRILVLVCGNVVGGHEIQLKTILQDMCAMSDKITILCQSDVTHRFFSVLPCAVLQENFSVAGKVWVQWKAGREIAAVLAPYLLQAEAIMVSGGTIEACIGAARASKLTCQDKKVVAYIPMYIDRSDTHGTVGKVYNCIVDRMAGIVDEYLTINRIQASLLRRYSKHRVKFVENTIQIVRPPIESKGKRLIYLGRFDDKQKRLVELISMLDRVENPYTDVVFIGDGPDKEDIVVAAQAAKYIKVSFFGWMSVIQVDNFLGSEDCLIMNSRWEGEPLVVREFTARRLPCVVRAITGMRGISNRNLRFGNSDQLLSILRTLYDASSNINFIQKNRIPQLRRRDIITSCF